MQVIFFYFSMSEDTKQAQYKSDSYHLQKYRVEIKRDSPSCILFQFHLMHPYFQRVVLLEVAEFAIIGIKSGALNNARFRDKEIDFGIAASAFGLLAMTVCCSRPEAAPTFDLTI